MQKTISAILCTCIAFLFSFQQSQAQSGFKGTVKDSSENKMLRNAVISLLKPADSVLVKFTRSADNGTFSLEKIVPGKYILEVSYPGYATFSDFVESKTGEITDLNFIHIIPKAKLLEEIVIQQKVAAIRIKGDTTEFKADSFKVGPNANVQELLKRLPGLQVNSKGEITAQGQKVEKVLVDGEEFFSDDPAVVTQNLRADVVDKVQVFDKKSEQAEFTGVDDGEKKKTINLELKEDKKKGFFGKIEAGSDFDKYRNGKAMINSFKKKQKIAAYVTHNNTSFEGLNWNERRNYGSDDNMNVEVTEDGGMMIWSRGDEFSYGNGIPESTTAGLGYANKWNKDKNSFSGNYQFNDQSVHGRNTSFTKTILPTGSFSNSSVENFKTSGRRNKLNGIYEWKIDSNNTIKFKANGSVINRTRYNNYEGFSESEGSKPINNITRTISSNNESKDFTSELSWKKRFKKQGRTFSYTGNWSNNSADGTGFLNSTTNYFDTNEQISKTQVTDQKKTNNTINTVFQNKLIFTESLTKKLFLELSYKNSFNNNNAESNTLEKPAASTQYNSKVDSLSNHFRYKATDHTGGISFRFTEKKYSFSIGTQIGRTGFKLKELNKGYKNSRVFTRLLPTASIKYTPKKQRSITLNYNGSTQNPTLQQINPIIDNIDPLNISIGNANLKQAFRHNFSFQVSDFKIIKSKNFYFSGNYSFTNNAITNSSQIDSGKTVNQKVNVNGNYDGNFWTMYGFEIAPSLNLNINSSGNTSRHINFVNGIKNFNTYYRIGLGIGMGMWNDKWINFNFNLEPSLNYSKSTISTNTTKYWSLNCYPYTSMKFKRKSSILTWKGI
ncbi:MAG: TonB-dependent receptor [Lacibacter sp.]